VTNLFLDAEFYEDGKTIEMISLALVGEEDTPRRASYLYIENDEFDWEAVPADHWIQKNVQPMLGTYGRVHPKKIPFKDPGVTTWGDVIQDFVKWFPQPWVFWGYYAAYDWVLLAQQFGPMVKLPKDFPMFCMDLKQWAVQLGDPTLPEQEAGMEHHALADARWNKTVYEYLDKIDRRGR
jgi:hypothetical protein